MSRDQIFDMATQFSFRQGPRIMWMLGVDEENDPALTIAQAKDIADHGFEGVLLTPRAGNLDLRDPRMITLLETAAQAADSNGMEVWIMADPRLMSKSIIDETGHAQKLLIVNRTPTDTWKGNNPNIVEIKDGKFKWQMEYPELRPTHILQSGGITYTPDGIEKVIACKFNRDGQVEESVKLNLYQTSYDEAKRILTVTSEPGTELDGWHVIAFPKFKTNMFDYSSDESWKLWFEYVEDLLERMNFISGICSDEPGFYAESGQYPMSDQISDQFIEMCDSSLEDNLAFLILDAEDNTHVETRLTYFDVLNAIIGESSLKHLMVDQIASNLGIDHIILNGIHATWHGEFCGLEEMNHGSMNVFYIRDTQSAAFTDVGGAERLMNPPDAPDVVYSLALARSMSLMYPNPGLSFSNLWGVDYGEPDSKAPEEIIDYWYDLLNAFNANWLVHAYGYTGTRHQDMGFGPGYPKHPSWDRLGEILNDQNRRITDYTIMPEFEVLIVLPTESFYMAGHNGLNNVGWEFVKLVDAMVRKGYQVSITCPTMFEYSIVDEVGFLLTGSYFKTIIIPYCTTIGPDDFDLLNKAAEIGVNIIADYPNGTVIERDSCEEIIPPEYHKFSLMDNPMHSISKIVKPGLSFPKGSIGLKYETRNGFQLRIVPDRPGGSYSGKLSFMNQEIEIRECSTVTIISVIDDNFDDPVHLN